MAAEFINILSLPALDIGHSKESCSARTISIPGCTAIIRALKDRCTSIRRISNFIAFKASARFIFPTLPLAHSILACW